MIKNFIYTSLITLLLSGCGSTVYMIQTDPLNSKVLLNGSKEYITPAKIELEFSDKVKVHNLLVKKDGYVSKPMLITEAQVEIDKQNKSLDKKVNLEPLVCTSDIVTNTDDVEILIDEQMLGYAPKTIALKYGDLLEHKLDLKKDGFIPKSDLFRFDSTCEEIQEYTLQNLENDYSIVSYPQDVEVYLGKKLLGKTPLKTTIEFGEYGLKRVLKLKKKGFATTSHEVHFDDKVSDVLVKMDEIKYKELAYIVPEISMENQKILFKVDYERGYRDTIDNSPNALHVKQVLSMDSVNYLIDDLDAFNNNIVYTVVHPKNQLNTQAYTENIYQIKQMIIGLEKTLKDPKNALNHLSTLSATVDENVLISINEDLFAFYLNIFNAVEKEQAVENYLQNINDLLFSYEKHLEKFLTLNVSDFYSDIWMSDNTKGFRKTKITDSDRRWIDKSPSLDEDYIYFSSNRNSKDFGIWRVSRKGGSGMTKITNSPYSQDLDPSSDNNGTLISYTTIPMDSIQQQVWTINKKGYLPSQLKKGYQTSIAKDKIVFVRKSKYTDRNQIWTMNSDGSGETVLTDERYNCFDPSLSNDGSHIVFTSDQSGNKDIWMMKIDGSSITQLTTNPSADLKPVFDENNQVVFISNRGMIWGIWSLVPKLEEIVKRKN